MTAPLEPDVGRGDREIVDVLIIGAGMSGMSCAAKLLDHPTYGANGHKSVAVLEGRHRVGGRIGSINVNGCRLDTGANWIHGIGDKDGKFGVNPLVDILPNKAFRQLSCSVFFRPPRSASKDWPVLSEGVNRTCSPTTESDHDDGWVRVDSSPASAQEDLVIPSKVSSRLFGAMWGMIGALHERSSEESAKSAKNISLLRAIVEDEDFKAAFESLPKEHHQALRALPQFVEAMEAGPLNEQSAETDNDKPGLGLLEYAIEDFDGDQVFLRDGYTAVLQEVGKKVIEQGRVELDTEVAHISWDGELVEVTTIKGDTYAAKQVVCTLPLGVLQHHQSTIGSSGNIPMFLPELPSDKTEAIESLGFGTLDKIFLVYDKPWWKDEKWLQILRQGLTQFNPADPEGSADMPDEPDGLWGFTDELPGIEIGADGEAKEGVRAMSVMNLHALTGFPVLSCFVSCANARHIEGLSDDEAAAIVHRSLTAWLGQTPPAPCAAHVTRWARDEYARGSYSHMITGLSETRHRSAFAQPVTNEYGADLRFAGEHTSRNHFATVHGALLSGWREARAIIARDQNGSQAT